MCGLDLVPVSQVEEKIDTPLSLLWEATLFLNFPCVPFLCILNSLRLVWLLSDVTLLIHKNLLGSRKERGGRGIVILLLGFHQILFSKVHGS